MKLYLSVSMLLVSLGLLGQSTFTSEDREKVKKAVTDPNAGAYKELLRRFTADDTTMTLEDYRLLYYGAAFQKTYAVFKDENKKGFYEAMNAKDYEKAGHISDTMLMHDPISLFGNYARAVSMYLADKTKTDYIVYRDRFRHLTDAIISSGDGLTCETGFRVNTVPDEYTMMYNYFYIEEIQSQALVSHCDKMTVKPVVTWKKETLYFDATEILNKEAELFK